MDQIRGFALAGYRSFPSERIAQLTPLGKINLIVGQNNSGKSNVLRVIAETFRKKDSPQSGDPRWDRPLQDSERRYRRYLAASRETLLERYVARDQKALALEQQLHGFLQNLRTPDDAPPSSGDLLWIGIEPGWQISKTWMSGIGRSNPATRALSDLSIRLTGQSGGVTSGENEDAKRIMALLAAGMGEAPLAEVVEGVRAITSDDQDAPDLNGRSIKRRLLELQNPSSDRLEARATFLRIQDFVRSVMDDDSVTIDIPHDLKTIHVTQAGRTLPIEYMGTGIHEVVIIAAAASVVTGSVMCIEEPEVHLHPVLQRKLLRYLAHQTDNQYFIATHSAHLLDSELGSIFHVTTDTEGSRVAFAGSASERSAVCADLGYRPSDLVQTNAVIWVEGPSDRIYLQHWIERLAPGRFIEGVHYSIMFYGGSLLRELSPLDRDEAEEFISLRHLNRFMAVVIDSDKTYQSKPLNRTKQRVIAGLENDPDTGFAWVTGGYTIENYVPQGVLDAAIKAAHPTTANATFSDQERWKNPLARDRIGIASPSKVAIARKAVEFWDEGWPYKLKASVERIVRLIEAANENA